VDTDYNSIKLAVDLMLILYY